MKIFFLKISFLVLLFVHSNNSYSQQLSETETVQYIQNTFNNYKIYFLEGNSNYGFGLEDANNKIIKYNNPIVTIEFGGHRKSTVSFNVNDVLFKTDKSKKLGWEQFIISGDTNIRYKDKFTSTLNFCMTEEIVTTRLKNAFTHLHSISGKGASKPDPFDNPTSTNTETEKNSSINQVSTQTNKQTFPEAGFSVQCPCKLYKNEVYLQQLKSYGLVSSNEQAYVCAEGYETNPMISVIYNVNVISLDNTFNGNIESLKSKKEYIDKFGLNDFQVSTFKGMKALERSFSMGEVPHKAIAFVKNGRFYLLMVGNRTNLNKYFSDFANSFNFIN